eukprot:g6088.t1
MKDELGTLYLQYEKSYWYWELIEMLKKIFFTGLLLIIGNGMAFTIVIAIIVQFIYILVVEKHGPYITDRDDLVQFMGSVQLFLTLLAGLVLKLQENNETDNINEKDNEILGGILIAINASVLLMAAVSIFFATSKGQKCFESLTKGKVLKDQAKMQEKTKVAPSPQKDKLKTLQEIRKAHGASSAEYKEGLRRMNR